MRKTRIFILAALAIVSLMASSCKGDGTKTPEKVAAEKVITGIDDSHWTYFSFETGETVGRSTFLSEEEDKAWAARSDWDFAICGDRIKTNGGESGNGQGGVLRDTQHNFLTLETAPDDGYLEDEVMIVD
jgi:hypothetical protein